MSQRFYFKQFTLALVHCLVLFDPLTGPLSGVTTKDHRGSGSDGIEGLLCIPQISSSDCFESYQDTRWGVLPSIEVQSVYSTVPADWAKQH